MTQTFLGIPDGVYVSSTNGIAGTSYPIGTSVVPVDNLTDALAIATERHLNIIYIQDDTGLALPSGVTWPICLIGRQLYYDSLDLNGQTLGCSIKGLKVTGAFLGTADFEDCYLTAVSGPTTSILRCEIESIGPITASLIVHGSWGERGTAEIDLTGNNAATNVVEMSGQVILKNVDQAGCVVNIVGRDLVLTLDATCILGTINIYGVAKVTDNSVGSTVNDYSIETTASAIKTQTDKLAGSTSESSTTKNWNTAVDSPDGTGGLVVDLGSAATRNKLHSLLLDVNALTVGAIINVKLFLKVNSNQRKTYDVPYVVGTDPDGLWIVNGTVGIHDVLSVAVYSDTNENVAIGYTAILEAM